MSIYTLGTFAKALNVAALAIPKRINWQLTVAAKLIQHRARSYIGQRHFDWEPLSLETLRIKYQQGYSHKGPLERTGVMKRSITYRVLPFEAIIESYNRAMYYHETGTMYMPKRPVLSRAVFKSKAELVAIFGKSIFPLITITRGKL